MVLSELYVQPTLSSVLKNMAEVALKAIPKDFDHLINLAEFNRCQGKKAKLSFCYLVRHEVPKYSQTLVT